MKRPNLKDMMLAPTDLPVAPQPGVRSAAAVSISDAFRSNRNESEEARREAREARAEAERARRDAEEKQRLLDASELVIEIDPTLVDPSPLADRLPDPHDTVFADLKARIETAGQQQPILVRPHPTTEGRYQAAYGHRRLRACLELGRPVRAVVKPLSDAELRVAQVQENQSRKDLSFIERALFASALVEAGDPQSKVAASLGMHQPDISVMSLVAKLDRDLLQAIGPAPKVGRPRWKTLAETLAGKPLPKRVSKVLESEEFRTADSNRRFALVASATETRAAAETAVDDVITDRHGRELGRVRMSASGALTVQIRDKRIATLLRDHLGAWASEIETSEPEGG